VGAPGEDSNATGVGGTQTNESAAAAGAVYVFIRSGVTWTQQAYLKASNTDAGDNFGNSVSLSGDGNLLAVGAENEDSSAAQTNNSAADAGAVYVFARTGTSWSQQAYLKAANAEAADQFGHAVALSGDGSTLAAGAVGEAGNATGVGGTQTNNSMPSAGAVYVFVRSGSTWTSQAYVKASNTGSSDQFGWSVALSTNGATLLVGAVGEDSHATGVGGDQSSNGASGSGAAYVYTRSGTTWTHQAYVKASNTRADDQFGESVTLNGAGTVLAVGATGEAGTATNGNLSSEYTAPSAGAAYVYTLAGGTWTHRHYVKASNTAAGDRLGLSLGLNSSGTLLVVGADNEDSDAKGINSDQNNDRASSAGAVYVYQLPVAVAASVDRSASLDLAWAQSSAEHPGLHDPVVLPAASGSAFVNYTRRFDYDNAGNLTAMHHAGATHDTLSMVLSTESNRAVAQSSGVTADKVEACFDAHGNLRELAPGQPLTWDIYDRLSRAVQIRREGGTDDAESYGYGGDGLRIRKWRTRLVSNLAHRAEVRYLPGLELRQDMTSGEMLEIVVAGGAGRTRLRLLHWAAGKPGTIANDQARYSLSDHLNSVTLELDQAGLLISAEEYYPYGGTAVWTPRSAVEADYKTPRYSGKERDVTGLYDYGFRNYAPELSRWISPDPSGTIDGLNLYRMVRNNPVTLADVDGRAPGEPFHDLVTAFRPGDVLYGLNAPREEALEVLKLYGFQRQVLVPTKKSIRQKLFGVALPESSLRQNIIIQNDITNAVWNMKNPDFYATNMEIGRILADPERGIAFRSFLEKHPRYNVASDQLVKNSGGVLGLQVFKRLWKRTSKAGLEFQISARQRTVHFLADIIGDDIETVVSKKGHGASITSTELRWLYRHRETDFVRANVRFWRNGKEISHADIFDLPGWKSYAPKRTYASNWRQKGAKSK